MTARVSGQNDERVYARWLRVCKLKMMTQEFEAESIRRGYTRIYMHARAVALEFYKKQGYEIFGDEFIEATIPHRHA